LPKDRGGACGMGVRGQSWRASATTTAAPITSAGRFSPRGPLGISNLYVWNHGEGLNAGEVLVALGGSGTVFGAKRREALIYGLPCGCARRRPWPNETSRSRTLAGRLSENGATHFLGVVHVAHWRAGAPHGSS
jgi:hypothetical protein